MEAGSRVCGQRYCALAAAFGLGMIFGAGATVWPARLFAVATVILAISVAAIILLRRLAERSDDALLAGDFSYRAFFDAAVEGIFRTTPGGHYLDANPALARIYGYETPEALKAGLTDISNQLYVDPQRRAEFKVLMDEHDEVIDFVSAIRRRDGSTIWIKENARAVRDWSGRLVCYQGTVEDVTVKFAAESAIKKGLKRAEEANRTKNSFLAMMSHELKTPLNAIIGFSQIIEEEMLGPIGNKSYKGYISDIHASGKKLLAIINDVLDVARLEGAAVTLSRDQFCPHEIAAMALERSRSLTGDLREVILDIEGALPRLNVDQDRLAQVLSNLLSNALKFTPPSGEVRLEARQTGEGGIAFAVRDSGIGMSEAIIAMVLQPFRQADASLARRFEGAGLGLPIAHALVQLHGGTLVIASHEGRGTTATVELPPDCVCREESRAVA